MTTDSVRKRFVVTVGTNLFRSGLSFATGMLVARWLQPAAYGDMSFLLGTFVGVRAFLDMGTSAAFFTFLSQQSRTRRFVRAFLVWLACQFLVGLTAVGVLFPAAWIAGIWRGEPRTLVILAFVAAFMQNSVWPAVQQAGESQRKTIWVQAVVAAIVCVHLLAVIALRWFGVLGLYALFVAIAVEYGAAAIVVYRRLTFADPLAAPEDIATARAMFGKYLSYCRPLIPYAWISFAADFTDRWLLQRYGGGVQQAFYSVGAQFASVALIATTSILSIFWKEIAEANHRGDHERTAMLYHRVSRLLFFVGACLAGLLIPWSRDLLHLIVGPAYADGAVVLGIMFLYPAHQSMGQIGGTMLYATERISLQVALGTATMIAGMLATYFVLAPPDAAVPGLGLASTGLALKMVGVQIVSVNLLAFCIARIGKWPFDWIYQPITLVACVGLGWLAHASVTGAAAFRHSLILRMTLASLFYLSLLAAFLYAVPTLAGLSRAELVADARKGVALARRLMGGALSPRSSDV